MGVCANFFHDVDELSAHEEGAKAGRVAEDLRSGSRVGGQAVWVHILLDGRLLVAGERKATRREQRGLAERGPEARLVKRHRNEVRLGDGQVQLRLRIRACVAGRDGKKRSFTRMILRQALRRRWRRRRRTTGGREQRRPSLGCAQSRRRRRRRAERECARPPSCARAQRPPSCMQRQTNHTLRNNRAAAGGPGRCALAPPTRWPKESAAAAAARTRAR